MKRRRVWLLAWWRGGNKLYPNPNARDHHTPSNRSGIKNKKKTHQVIILSYQQIE
jgi:hypothetical protein